MALGRAGQEDGAAVACDIEAYETAVLSDAVKEQGDILGAYLKTRSVLGGESRRGSEE
jgi:hypothetical protein